MGEIKEEPHDAPHVRRDRGPAVLKARSQTQKDASKRRDQADITVQDEDISNSEDSDFDLPPARSSAKTGARKQTAAIPKQQGSHSKQAPRRIRNGGNQQVEHSESNASNSARHANPEEKKEGCIQAM